MSREIRNDDVTFGDLIAGVFAFGAIVVWFLLVVYGVWHFALNAVIALVPM